MPKVSVIVPVYNVEKYLSSCIDSILQQTLQDIEVICVDDGSTDSSGSILDTYALRDSRVRVLHRDNAGYGAAMNAGLDLARGEYIGIVESDDCILPEMYHVLYSAAVRDDLDLVKSDAISWLETAAYTREIHYQRLDSYYDRVLCDEDRNVFFDFLMNIWTGIYKRDFLLKNDIRFHESPGASYQDNGFWIQTLLYCQRAMWISQAFYLYRQDNPAASVKSRSKMLSMANEYEYLAQTLCERKEYHFLAYCYYFKLFRHRGTFMRIADEHKREFCEQIKEDFRLYKGYIKGNSFVHEWLRKIATRPDEVCYEYIQKKQQIVNRLEHAKGIIIYGAGRRGDIVFRGLYNEGFYEKICCFAESQEPSEKLLAGKQILSIQKACDMYPDALIIIAVIRGSGMYRQMVEKLTEMGIGNFMDGTEIEENFYIII